MGNFEIETELKNMLRLFYMSLQEYERESGSKIGYDEREPEEMVEIFIDSEDCFNYENVVKNCSKYGVSLSFPDIRNKLSPIKNLIAMIENGYYKDTIEPKYFLQKEIEQSKESIKYLTGNVS